jgi:hypothetical protein
MVRCDAPRPVVVELENNTSSPTAAATQYNILQVSSCPPALIHAPNRNTPVASSLYPDLADDFGSLFVRFQKLLALLTLLLYGIILI